MKIHIMKKMIKIISIFLFFVGFLVSCSSGRNFTTEDLNNLLMDYNQGIIAGVDIGDSWEDIKKTLNQRWIVSEDLPGSVRLSDDMNNFPDSQCFVILKFDSNQKVNNISVGIDGKDKEAILALKKFYKKIEYRASQLGKPQTTKGWYLIEREGAPYDISLQYMDHDHSDMISFEVMKQ
jgi:hypothetical protein